MVSGTPRSIGQVLELLKPEFPDITISKIRFLESQGLLHPERTPSGYRKFHDADIEQLRWVLAQQRDQFLPLKVIKDKLESGGWADDGADGSAAVPPPPRGTNPLDVGATDISMDRDELLGVTGLTASQLQALERAGLVAGDPVGDDQLYDADALLAAKAAAGLLARGLEVRHLRSYRVAAEREAGMLDQMATPLSRHGGSDGRRKAQDLLGELINLGEDLRRATLRRALRAHRPSG